MPVTAINVNRDCTKKVSEELSLLSVYYDDAEESKMFLSICELMLLPKPNPLSTIVGGGTRQSRGFFPKLA